MVSSSQGTEPHEFVLASTCLCNDVRVFGRALPLIMVITTISIPNSPLSRGGWKPCPSLQILRSAWVAVPCWSLLGIAQHLRGDEEIVPWSVFGSLHGRCPHLKARSLMYFVFWPAFASAVMCATSVVPFR